MQLFKLFFITLIIAGCQHTNSSYTILFDNVEGLETGADVKCKGVKVGEVTDLRLFRDKIAVVILLNDTTRIPAGSRFIINRSFIGAGYIAIEPSLQTIFLSSGDTVKGEYQQNLLWENISTDSTKRKKLHQSMDKIGEGIRGLIEMATQDSASDQ